jgi:hypothetical protein
MKLANIVYETELVNHAEVGYINYYKGPIEYEKLEKLPTLYVGWSFMKASNPQNEIIQHADILKKKIISNELYWELSFDEGKSSHVKGVENFVSAAPQYYFLPKYTYVNLDPVFFQLKDIQDLFDVIPKEIDATYNFKNEMLYLLKTGDTVSRIIGINLKMYEFFKFGVTDIVNEVIIRTEGDNYHNDFEGLIYLAYYKMFPNFSHLKRYLITILTK